MRSIIQRLLAAALLVGSMTANAITVSLDNANPTVARPTSGSVTVDFFGSGVLGAGEHVDAITGIDVTCPYEGALGLSCSLAPIPSLSYLFTRHLLFTVIVESDSHLGLYDSAHFEIRYHNLAGEPDLALANYSVRVVGAVPEPGTFALLVVGLAAIRFTRRRRAY